MTDEEAKEKLAGKKLVIATPMYGGMCSGTYVQGLIGTITKMTKLGVHTYWVQLTNESLITRGRNELARIFLGTDAEYMMFIDADICFDMHAVAWLMAAEKDIACGIYPKKEVNWESVKRAARDGNIDNLEDYAGAFVLNLERGDRETDETGCVEVRHAGTGFMLIHRRVFEKLMPFVPQYRRSSVKDENGEYTEPLTYEFFDTSIDHTGALLSEDYHFCDLWRQHGGKIHANPFIKLQHSGSYMFDGDIIKSGGKIK